MGMTKSFPLGRWLPWAIHTYEYRSLAHKHASCATKYHVSASTTVGPPAVDRTYLCHGVSATINTTRYYVIVGGSGPVLNGGEKHEEKNVEDWTEETSGLWRGIESLACVNKRGWARGS